jgi:putative membrane protein
MRLAVLTVALAAAIASTASAQQSPPTAHPPSTSRFIEKAAITNMFEVQAGQLAQQKSSAAPLTEYAKMIVDDHQKAQDELKSAAQGIQGATLPRSLDQAHESMLQELKMSSGKPFENAFKLQQVEGHKQAILLVESYAKAGDNPQLQQWAQKALPVLRKHLAHAQELPPSPNQS